MAILQSNPLSIEIKHLIDGWEYDDFPAFIIYYQLQFFINGIPLLNPSCLNQWHHCTGTLQFTNLSDQCSLVYWLTRILEGRQDIFMPIEPPTIELEVLRTSKLMGNCFEEDIPVIEFMEPGKRKALAPMIVGNAWGDETCWLKIHLDNNFFVKSAEHKWHKTPLVFYLPTTLLQLQDFRDALRAEYEKLETWMEAEKNRTDRGIEKPGWAERYGL